MNRNGKPNVMIGSVKPSFLKENLADFLTLSRGIIGLVILSLSSIGKDAYITVVILTLFGAITDIFDGKAARHYLGENREGRLGKYDLEVDTFFVFCAIGYLSLSEIVIPKVLGLGWIGLALITIALYKRKPKILLLFEIPSIIALIFVTGIYDLGIFSLIILPAIVVALIINRKRVFYLLFEYWPQIFSR